MFELILANIAYHVTLDPAEKQVFLAKLHHKQLKKNSRLLKSGEVCGTMSFVIKGCLRIFHTDAEDREHIVSFCPEDWWALDVSSFFSKQAAFYSIDALEDTEIFEISYPDLENLLVEVPKFERFFRILSQNGFVIYQQRITSSLSATAEERLQLFQQRYPMLQQRIAQKHIAAYLGITPVFLSMLRKRK